VCSIDDTSQIDGYVLSGLETMHTFYPNHPRYWPSKRLLAVSIYFVVDQDASCPDKRGISLLLESDDDLAWRWVGLIVSEMSPEYWDGSVTALLRQSCV
jgi:hypothetical protein